MTRTAIKISSIRFQIQDLMDAYEKDSKATVHDITSEIETAIKSVLE